MISSLLSKVIRKSKNNSHFKKAEISTFLIYLKTNRKSCWLILAVFDIPSLWNQSRIIKRLSLCQSVIFFPLCRSRVHLSVSCVCYGELSLKATLSVSFKDKFVENISKEREEASCLLLHDMWPSVAISDFSPWCDILRCDIVDLGGAAAAGRCQSRTLMWHLSLCFETFPPLNQQQLLCALFVLESSCIGDIWEAMPFLACPKRPSLSLLLILPRSLLSLCRDTFRHHSTWADCLFYWETAAVSGYFSYLVSVRKFSSIKVSLVSVVRARLPAGPPL